MTGADVRAHRLFVNREIGGAAQGVVGKRGLGQNLQDPVKVEVFATVAGAGQREGLARTGPSSRLPAV